jgi:hypothetical protein
MHDFVGRWNIVEMSAWPQHHVDLIEPGYFEFDENGLGEFVFGAVKGFLDVRVSHRTPLLEYSWQGVSEGREYCGRGSFVFDTPNKGVGMLFIHCGDESHVIIQRKN